MDRTERIITLCNTVGATEIVIGDGYMAAVHDLEMVRQAGIKVLRQPFNSIHPVYRQLHSERQRISFVKGLSILDALLNIGASAVSRLIADPILAPVVIS